MKKLITLCLAMALTVCAAFNAMALELDVSGGMWMQYEWTDNKDFTESNEGSDDFVAQQRVRTQIDFGG